MDGICRLVICEDLIDAKRDVRKLGKHCYRSWKEAGDGTYQKRTFHGIASATAYAPGAEEYSTGDSGANQYGIYIANLWKSRDTVKKVA